MDVIGQGVKEGILLILSLDPELIQVTLLSLQVSLTALVAAGLLGIPAGTFLALKNFTGRKLILNIIYTLFGLPPGLAGLCVFLVLSIRCPL